MEEISIHEFDFALINEFFTELERQGPLHDSYTIMIEGESMRKKNEVKSKK